MENNRKDLEFDVLGYNIKLKQNEDNSQSPSEIIEYVRQRAMKIQERNPNLDRGQIAILMALGLAVEKKNLEKEFKDNVETLQISAFDALSFIEEVTPTSL
jgi:cell division protein ZapA (FtsZ GTPase activity inhibitor)